MVWVVEVGAAADACADGEAEAAVFAAVVVGVLEALDGEVAGNVGNDVFGGANGAFHEEGRRRLQWSVGCRLRRGCWSR